MRTNLCHSKNPNQDFFFSYIKKINHNLFNFFLVLSFFPSPFNIYIMSWIDRLNDYVAHSRVGKYFQLDNSGARRERKGTKFTTEIRAGFTTFFAMVHTI